MRRYLYSAGAVLLVILAFLGISTQAQELAKRLVLKDGSYQSATKWEIKGDRVRYLSAERNEWEELPYAMVDWAATEKYEKDRASGSPPPEAREVDKEAEAEHAEAEAASPAVAPNLRLPDFEGAFVLDTFQGNPELVELEQNTGEINRNTKDNLLHAAINPISSAKQTIELQGPHAKVQAHASKPSFFINAGEEAGLDTKVHTDQQAQQPQQPSASNDNKAQGPQQPERPQQARFDVSQHYRIIRAELKKDNRVVGNIKIAFYGKVSQHQSFIPTMGEKYSGNWVKITPVSDLPPGEYALVEMVADKGMNLYVWDFGVNPSAPENPSAWKPEAPANTKTSDQMPTLDKRK